MLKTELLFPNPHQPLSDKIAHLASSCVAAHIVTGFVTVDGIRSLPECLRSGSLLKTFLVGSGTQRGFDAMDKLLADGLPRDRLRIHLGHTRHTKPKAVYPFLRYHPMLHGKIYLFEYRDGTFAAIVGSHNVTNFALNGLNGEAAVCISGPTSDPAYSLLVSHIEQCRKESSPYQPEMKEAYAWWTEQFADGLAAKAMDRHRDYERRYTLIVFCQGSAAPAVGSELYLELPAKLYQKSLRIDVHGYVFDKLPRDSKEALAKASQARATFTGELDGLMSKRGAVELLADWELVGTERVLTRTVKPFRPKPAPRHQQARVEVRGPLSRTYIYAFDWDRPTWKPDLDNAEPLRLSDPDVAILEELDLIPEEHLEWYRVSALIPEQSEGNAEFKAAAEEASARFILFSPRRTSLMRLG